MEYVKRLRDMSYEVEELDRTRDLSLIPVRNLTA
jgi:hypothetical protein